MGVKEALQEATRAAFLAFDNVASSCTYTVVGIISYNPTTGASSSTDDDYLLEHAIILDNYNLGEIDNETVRITDMQGLVPGELIDDNSITPKVSDTIAVAGVTREIINISRDPADALYVFQLRIPS